MELRNMVKKLTWRQSDALLSIYLRLQNFGYVSAGDIVSDSGASINTVGTHLQHLFDMGLILQPEGKKVKNLNFGDMLAITDEGISRAEYQLFAIKANKNESIKNIYEKNKACFQSRSNKGRSGFYINSNSPFSKIFNEIVAENKAEPVITSMAMYSELDSQLAVFSESDWSAYNLFSQTRLNMAIRSGRIASMAIPISLRGNIPQSDLFKILGDSWSWPGTVSPKSIYRYLGESISLGIAQKQGNTIISLKPTTTDTIAWLASKVNSAFQNVPSIDPKAALVVFRETFSYPTKDELLYPKCSDSDWLNRIYTQMNDEKEYRKIMDRGIDLLLNQAKIIDYYEGRLMPRTVIRKIKSVPQMEEKFRFITSRAEDGNLAASVLLTITAKPGITKSGLREEINANHRIRISEAESDMAVTTLSNVGLVHVSKSYLPEGSPVRLHAFTHIPYLVDKSSESTEANAVIKGLQPSMLSTMNEMFPKVEERAYLYNIINRLCDKKILNLDDIEKEFNKPFARKIMSLSNTALKPLMMVDPTFTNLELVNSKIAEVVLNTVQYSMLTNNESLGMYSQALSDMIFKDRKYCKTMESDALELKQQLLADGINNN
jgi:hypothetical protein